MKTITVKELMVPLQAYATVHQEATLREAVFALENAQMTLAPSRHLHRAILVLDENGKVVSKIIMKDILVALEAIDFVKYGFGFFILSMLLLWIIGFLVIYPIVGFPEGILEQATKVLESAAR
ncbi:hypothetical protein ACFL36_01520 [Thermodesulfobacteriota bacterium]